MCALFAATHPDRSQALVTMGPTRAAAGRPTIRSAAVPNRTAGCARPPSSGAASPPSASSPSGRRRSRRRGGDPLVHVLSRARRLARGRGGDHRHERGDRRPPRAAARCASRRSSSTATTSTCARPPATWARGSRARRWSRSRAPTTCRGRATRASVLDAIEQFLGGLRDELAEPNLILTTVLEATSPESEHARARSALARFRGAAAGRAARAAARELRRPGPRRPLRERAGRLVRARCARACTRASASCATGALIGPAAGHRRRRRPRGRTRARSSPPRPSPTSSPARASSSPSAAPSSCRWRAPHASGACSASSADRRDYRTFTAAEPGGNRGRGLCIAPMAQMISTIRNGVDTQQLFGTLDTIAGQPELGAFTFRASNRWIDGAHNRSRIQAFSGAGQEEIAPRGVRARRRRAAGPARHRLGPEPGRVPAARAAACLTTTLVYSPRPARSA